MTEPLVHPHPAPMRTVLLPDPELAPFVRMSMIGRFDTDTVHMPASADVQLLVYLQGGALVADAEGRWHPLPAMFAAGARLAPSSYRVLPGSRFVGVVFRPGGFHACFGIPAEQARDRVLPLDAVLAPALVERIANQAGEAHTHGALLDMLRQLLLARPRSLGRIDAVPALPLDSLLLPGAQLAARLGVGARQLERRFLASHGLPLRDFRRLARFSSSLARLMLASPRAPALAAVAAEARYSDQAHFTREFRAFLGQTPRQFLAARGMADPALQLWQFDRDELAAFADLA